MKVLVADDDAITRRMVAAVLGKWGYQTVEAGDGHEAWELLQSPEPPPVAVVDWMMPGLSGIELCRRLKRSPAGQSVYFILLTSRGESRDVVEGLESGADDFVVKPYHSEELRARVGVGRRLVELRLALIDANHHLEERVRQRTRDVERLLHWNENLLHHLSHDLRTPLTPLISLLPILVEEEEDEERRTMLSLALEGARSIQALSAGVSELCHAASRSCPVRSEARPVRELVDAALEECRRTVPVGGRRLVNEVPAGLVAPLDAVLVRRILQRLLSNAVRFTADQGAVRVTVGESAGEVRLVVTDDGVGLAPEQVGQVFEPFYKADDSRHDRRPLGLGLAVARIYAEQLGGRLWAESEGLGRGSSFVLSVPSGPVPAR